ncbi:MAG: hypothetical protein WCD37_19160 [Chloroflexia bacterium]
MNMSGSSAIYIAACLSFLLVIAGVIAIYFIAATRKASDAVKEKPTNLKRVSAPLPYSDTINRVLGVAAGQGYKVEEVAHDGSRAILSTPITIFSYGFFYPIYFSVEPGGGTLVEVGIASRAIQWGPVVTHNHEKCFNMVRQAVLPYAPPSKPPPYPQQPMPAPYSSQPPPYLPYPNQPPAGPSYPNQPPPPYPPNPNQPPGSGPSTPG